MIVITFFVADHLNLEPISAKNVNHEYKRKTVRHTNKSVEISFSGRVDLVLSLLPWITARNVRKDKPRTQIWAIIKLITVHVIFPPRKSTVE